MRHFSPTNAYYVEPGDAERFARHLNATKAVAGVSFEAVPCEDSQLAFVARYETVDGERRYLGQVFVPTDWRTV